MKNDSLRAKIINRNKGVTSLRDYAEGWNFRLKLRLVPVTASRPSGEGNRRYAKWPSLESVAQPSALPGRWHPEFDS